MEKKVRTRFKRSRVCSSDNYSASRKANREYLSECHESFVELDIKVEIHVVHHYYTPCFESLIEISEERAKQFKEHNIPIIIK